MADKATGRDSDKFMLRLPDGMRDRIAEEASANGRSMNAEIVARLERSLNGPAVDDPLLTESDLALVRQIHDRSQETLRDITDKAERITVAVEILLSKATVMPGGAPASEPPTLSPKDTKGKGE